MAVDGDSLYNAGWAPPPLTPAADPPPLTPPLTAGHCLANGHGTARDDTGAVHMFEQAAFRFGHFDAIHALGERHLNGRVPGRPRDPREALRFLAPSAMGGDWCVHTHTREEESFLRRAF